MYYQLLPPANPPTHHNINMATDSPYNRSEQVVVDTSSPFSSVREAVATYGERFLARKLVPPEVEDDDQVHNNIHFPVEEVKESHELITDDGGDYDNSDADNRDVNKIVHHHHHTTTTTDYRHYDTLITIFKKLEIQLGDAKKEINSLKNRESENEVALASLKAELHKCMSKIAKMEATEAANYTNNNSTTALRSNSTSFDSRSSSMGGMIEERRRLLLDPKLTTITTKESHRRQTTISDILSYGDVCQGYDFAMKQQHLMTKRKPIVPLLTDIFFICGGKKNTSPKYGHNDHHISLLTSL